MAQYQLASVGNVKSKPNYKMAFNEILGQHGQPAGGQFAFSEETLQGRNPELYNLPVDMDGNPFMNFRDYAGRNTTNNAAGSRASITNSQMGVAFDSVQQRKFITEQGVTLQNSANDATTFNSMAMGNQSFSGLSCTSDSDCLPFNKGNIKYSCNSNFSPWQDSKGNQPGAVCVPTVYPELDFVNEEGDKEFKGQWGPGMFGTACSSDNDCTGGYVCNPDTDSVFGATVDTAGQKGYCTLKYQCGTEERYLPTTWNNSIPFGDNNNNDGQGFKSEAVCLGSGYSPAQDCVQQNNIWYRVYPGYCPITYDYRKGGVPQGALDSSSQTKQRNEGIKLSNGFANQFFNNKKKSTMGAQSAFNEMSMTKTEKDSSEPLDLIASWNGKTGTQIKAQNMLFGN